MTQVGSLLVVYCSIRTSDMSGSSGEGETGGRSQDQDRTSVRVRVKQAVEPVSENEREK